MDPEEFSSIRIVVLTLVAIEPSFDPPFLDVRPSEHHG
jgi:hypothetical protein